MLESKMESLPDNSWIRWSRVEDRPFNTISDLYRKWCRLNNCFGKHYRTGREWIDVSLPVTEDNVLPTPSIFVTKYVTRDFFDWRYSPTSRRNILRFMLDYLFKMVVGGVVTWLLLDWSSNIIGFPQQPPQTVVDDGAPSESASTPPSDLHVLWWAMLFGFFGPFVLLLLLGLVFPIDEVKGLWDLGVEMLNYRYEPVPDITYPDYGPSFRFPTMSELIDWDQSRRVIPQGASPQIAFGWSEPWPYNVDWPEQYR
jgi:hypothetical protein